MDTFQGGQVVTKWDPGEYSPFRVGGGIFDLDLEVLKDASCLDSAHPRLQIRADADAYAGYVTALLCMSLDGSSIFEFITFLVGSECIF
jgi:hypothetical protein